MSVIRWEDPPPPNIGKHASQGHPIAHELIAFQLRRRPGEWGLLYEGPSARSAAHDISSGHYRAYRPAGSFEATQRFDGEVFRLYARFVGDPP